MNWIRPLSILLIPGLAFAASVQDGSLSASVVKIRSTNPASGISAVASGFAFVHDGKGFVLTAEHAVLNQALPGTSRIIRFSEEVEFTPGSVSTPPPGGWPVARFFKWISVDNRKPIEITEGAPAREFSIGEERKPSAFVLENRYELLFPDGFTVSAKYMISDWGKGITFLTFDPPKSERLPEWKNLKSRMRRAVQGEVTVAGFPASSRKIQINAGMKGADLASPPIAELDVMTTVDRSFAEFGMSGGAAWDPDGNYVGLVSHVTDDDRVLLIPGDRVREWTEAELEQGGIDVRLFKDLGPEDDIYYSRGLVFSMNCRDAPCEMRFDLNARENSTRAYPDDAQGTVRTGRARLADHAAHRVPGSENPYVASVTILGFRPRAKSLDDVGGVRLIGFDSAARFFQNLRDPNLIPVAEFDWNNILVTEKSI